MYKCATILLKRGNTFEKGLKENGHNIPFLSNGNTSASWSTHKKRAVNRGHFCKQLELRFFIFFSLRFLTNLDTGSKKDHFYLFNGPKIAQKIWILVKKRALKFILHAYISKYFRQTKLSCRGVLNISASPFFTVLTSLCSIQKRKLC